MEARYIQLDFFEHFDYSLHPSDFQELKKSVDNLRKGLFSRINKQAQRIKALEETIESLHVEIAKVQNDRLYSK